MNGNSCLIENLMKITFIYPYLVEIWITDIEMGWKNKNWEKTRMLWLDEEIHTPQMKRVPTKYTCFANVCARNRQWFNLHIYVSRVDVQAHFWKTKKCLLSLLLIFLILFKDTKIHIQINIHWIHPHSLSDPFF